MVERWSGPRRDLLPRALLGARVVAIVSAVVWGVFSYGVTDLAVVPLQDERFYIYYLLETGWGLLFIMLVAVSLISFAVHPRSLVFLQLVMAVACAILVTALMAPQLMQALPAVLLAITATVLTRWSGHGLRDLVPRSVPRVHPAVAMLLFVVVLASLGYAANIIRAARSGYADDDTWGLMHLPMQATLALAIAGTSLISVLARSVNATGWRLTGYSRVRAARPRPGRRRIHPRAPALQRRRPR